MVVKLGVQALLHTFQPEAQVCSTRILPSNLISVPIQQDPKHGDIPIYLVIRLPLEKVLP